MADNQNVKNRLLEFINFKGIRKSHFEKQCSLSNGYINSMVNTISYEKLDCILKAFPDLNGDWLMNGIGTMLRTDATACSLKEVEQRQRLDNDNIILVPVVNLDARGGFTDNVVTDTPEYVMEQIPFSADVARKGDFAMIVSGDSMYPRYPSGSYLLLREVAYWHEYLELSVPYLLELNDSRRVAKIVCKGSDKEHFLLKSVNPDFEDTEVAVSFVRRVYQIVMMLKREII